METKICPHCGGITMIAPAGAVNNILNPAANLQPLAFTFPAQGMQYTFYANPVAAAQNIASFVSVETGNQVFNDTGNVKP